MRRLLVLLLSLTLLYQGMAFAYSGMALCGGEASSMAMASATLAIPDPCCAGQPGDTRAGVATATDCGSVLGCSVLAAVFPDRALPAMQLEADVPLTRDPSFRSLEIRDVWRPPLTV